MKELAFMLKIDDRKVKIEKLQDLADLLETESENPKLGEKLQIPLSLPSGHISNLSPSDYDTRLRWWDKSHRRPIDLWRILQNFLHIRTSEHQEKPYIPADPDLGRVTGDHLHSAF